MGHGASRRVFLRNAAGGGLGLVVLANSGSVRGAPANSKLNVGLVGVGGRGSWFVDTLPRMENVVAFCDVNDQKIGDAFRHCAKRAVDYAKSPNAWEKNAVPSYARITEDNVRVFHDFRKMLDEMGSGIDAVVVATPDHTHAVASAAAIKAGKAVFCEKPLTRAVGESRALRELARKHKVATAMGNQGTYSGAFRRALELIRNGTLGDIKELHVWNSGGGSDKKEPPKGDMPVPEGFHWDLWLGPAAARPFHKDWLQRNAWRDFGTCQLGNWASHTANLAVMSMRVHELWLDEKPPDPHPLVRIHAKTTGINKLSFPKWELITWEIPARGSLPPTAITWYNGATPGRKELVSAIHNEISDPKERKLEFAGTYIVGTKGRLYATGHNATFGLLPEEPFKDVQRTRPEEVEQSRGPEQDWFAAARGGKPPWSSFDYADALNEFLMLGNVATQFEGTLEFDPVDCKIVNNAEADKLLRPEYREGWTL